MRNLALVFATLLAIVSASAAQALTYKWSFTSINGSSDGLVTGTISGLQIGSNSGAGLIVDVLSTPSGNGLGGGWTFTDTRLRGDAFTVAADKSVTLADASFFRNGSTEALFLGGFGGYYPELSSINIGDGRFSNTYHADSNGRVSFVLDEPPAVPLPAGLPLLLAGLGALGILRRRG